MPTDASSSTTESASPSPSPPPSPPAAAGAVSADPLGQLLGPEPPLATRLLVWSRRRPRAAIAAGGAIAVVALLASGSWFASSRGGPVGAAASLPPLPMTSRAPSPGTTAPGAGDSARAGRAGTSIVDLSATVWVDVGGAVVRPGLVALRSGARVAEAVQRAGGFAVDADVDRVNQAAVVRDGERVYVPRRGETSVPSVVAGVGPPPTERPAGGGSSDGDRRSPTPAAPVDLNTATAADLDELPGIGPATATAILAHREQHGPFASVDELADVRGIGPTKLEQLRPLVTVGGGS